MCVCVCVCVCVWGGDTVGLQPLVILNPKLFSVHCTMFQKRYTHCQQKDTIDSCTTCSSQYKFLMGGGKHSSSLGPAISPTPKIFNFD